VGTLFVDRHLDYVMELIGKYLKIWFHFFFILKKVMKFLNFLKPSGTFTTDIFKGLIKSESQ